MFVFSLTDIIWRTIDGHVT